VIVELDGFFRIGDRMTSPVRIVLPEKPVESLAAYLSNGGGQALKKALGMSRQGIIAEVKKSGLRGRGGAGFPTGMKWASVAHDPCRTKYFVCNGAEGEPGTFKDHMLMRRNPYQLLEGIAIGAYAIDAKKAFLGIKRSAEKEVAAVRRALKEMKDRGGLGPVPVELVLGPEDYLFGEEKALLEVIEGRDAMPREADLPPYVKGLFVEDPEELNPAVVNNVETISNIPQIVLRGASWFRSIGTPDSPGTMVFTVSGDIQRPGIYELPMGTLLGELLNDYGGGVLSGRKFKAILAGASNPAGLPSHLDIPLGFDSMRRAGFGLGSGGFIVYDDTACMVRVAHLFSRFLWLESCNQCISCKQGTLQSTTYLTRLIEGSGNVIDVDLVIQGADMAPHGNRCYLPVEHSLLTTSIIRNFAHEVIQHYGRGCQGCREVVLPVMRDFDEARGTFYYSPGRANP
jgi:NADH-quinone oxidoreductase subunit F